MLANELEQHVFDTYISLRTGLVAIAVAMPIVLVVGAAYVTTPAHDLQPSLSAYYDTPMRDVFVGLLFAVAAGLYLYKGFTTQENLALNLAGILAVGIAIFPHTWKPWGTIVTPHGVSAVGFFLVLAWVCWFRAGDTLRLITDEDTRKGYAMRYRMIAIVFTVSPVAAVAVNILGMLMALALVAEVFAIYAFAYYWYTKSRELKQTHADLMAVKGALRLDV